MQHIDQQRIHSHAYTIHCNTVTHSIKKEEPNTQAMSQKENEAEKSNVLEKRTKF